MAKLLLPTVSSLAFLPTVSIAARRRFHMEAMASLSSPLSFLAVSLGERTPPSTQSTFPGTEVGAAFSPLPVLGYGGK